MSAPTPARRHGPGSSHGRPVRTGRLLALALAIGLAPLAASLAPAQSVLPPAASEDAVPPEPPAGGAVPGAAEPRSEPRVSETAGGDGGAGAHVLPRDLSPWGMFLAADTVVKAVMIGLAFASLVTWTVWLAKSAEIAAAKVRARRALAALAASSSLAQAHRALSDRRGAVPLLVRAADHEVQVSLDDGGAPPAAGLLARVASALSRIEAQAGRRMTRGTGVLATIASTAPFVGLFGTVWGIMNAFIGISEAQTTNLAVVAPGIAEALLATALGLVAAIPAVVIYNHFARSISGYRQLLGDAAAAVERLVSRDLDRRSLRPAMRQAAE
ncbi:tonB-system energizer ExbB [Faunimonas sp. B44]|uniref:tonB-system energizer ExbB n=1 Tax=Faunimonas sp. B44 TaxID=3461493 RepID=UPI004044833A